MVSTQNKIIIPNIESIEKMWDYFSNTYSELHAKCLSSLFYTMLETIKIEKKKNILEVGCGSGIQLPYLLTKKNKNSTYLAGDLSIKMIAIANQRINNFQQNLQNQGAIHNIDYENLDLSKEEHDFPNFNLKLLKLNAEKLPFEDNTFDCYISNLCLMLTENAENMLKECHRVLQPGSKAIFSVWGRQENSQIMTIPVQLMAKYQQTQQQSDSKPRSNFYLNNKEKLIEMLEQNGFTNVLAWYQYAPFNFFEKDEIIGMLKSPANKVFFETQSKDKQQEVIDEVYNYFQEYYQKNKTPIGLEVLMIMGDKK